jgi:hypothetical protein
MILLDVLRHSLDKPSLVTGDAKASRIALGGATGWTRSADNDVNQGCLLKVSSEILNRE